MTRQDVIEKIAQKRSIDPKSDVLGYFMDVLEAAIYEKNLDRADWLFNKAVFFGLKAGIIDQPDDILQYFFQAN